MGEILYLIGVKVVRSAIGLGDILPGKGSQGKLGDDKRTEKGTDIFPQSPFREIAKDDLSRVHSPSKIKARLGLADDRTEQGIGDELRYLIEKGSDGFLAKLGILKLIETEVGLYRWISDVLDDASAVGGVNEKLGKSRQRHRLGLSQECIHRMFENVLGAGAPVVGIKIP